MILNFIRNCRNPKQFNNLFLTVLKASYQVTFFIDISSLEIAYLIINTFSYFFFTYIVCNLRYSVVLFDLFFSATRLITALTFI